MELYNRDEKEMKMICTVLWHVEVTRELSHAHDGLNRYRSKGFAQINDFRIGNPFSHRGFGMMHGDHRVYLVRKPLFHCIIYFITKRSLNDMNMMKISYGNFCVTPFLEALFLLATVSLIRGGCNT